VRRWLPRLAVVLAALLVCWIGGAWYYSGEIAEGALDVAQTPERPSAPPAPAPGAAPPVDVTYRSELGDAPAWLYPGEDDTWAIVVHGKGATRDDVRRVVRPLTAARLPTLAISYRNDADAPHDGRHGYGASERRDVQAAAAYAQSRGARDLVLVGFSMGGAIVTSATLTGELPLPVRGLVLDAPALDLEAAVELGAEQRELPLGLSLPSQLTDTAEVLADWRYGIDWDALDYVARAGELRAPILLFHGTADETVPVATSDALARDRPDLVTYHRIAGVGHVDAWDDDPAAYEAAVSDFLTTVAPAGG
jgi:pimeloyl-ACP methyl ester carboxylesterase